MPVLRNAAHGAAGRSRLGPACGPRPDPFTLGDQLAAFGLVYEPEEQVNASAWAYGLAKILAGQRERIRILSVTTSGAYAWLRSGDRTLAPADVWGQAHYDLRFRGKGDATVADTGFIDHIGIGVPDLDATKEYYDDLMPVLGLRPWFERSSGDPLNYGPDGARGSQLFFYQVEESGTYSRRETGLHHLAFLVASRSIVRQAHEWACARNAEILDDPQEFPQYGEHCFATYWLDPHGFKLETVCHTPEES